MRASALAAAALALALAALAPAARAGELIRFRTAEGVLGLVDEEEKLPAGATILSREPKRERPAAPAGPDEAGEAGAAALRPGARTLPAPAAPSEDAPPEDEAAGVARWCERATQLRLAREGAEADLEDARERYERCRTAATYCSEREVEDAEDRLEESEAREEDLAIECRRADCLPGWVREGCDTLP